MNIFLNALFLLQVLSISVAARFANTIRSMNGQPSLTSVRRALISPYDDTSLERSKRDLGGWNRMRNTLSKVSRTHINPTANSSLPNSLRDQIEQHYRNNAHQFSQSQFGNNPQTGKDDLEQQFLMDFFF